MGPYYDPKEFGLEIVGDVEWDNGSYQFNMTVVWKDAEGQLYYADDSGCSCLVPFEWAKSLGDLTKATRHEVLEHLNEWIGDLPERADYAADLIGKVAAL